MNIPISKPYINSQEEKIIKDVLRSGWLMQGKRVSEFESKIADYLKVKYAVAVTSGTAALHLSMLALGISKDDEVIVPSFSFVASANCILYVGAKPVFADVDEDTFNIDPKDVEKKITPKTKAIIAVHQIGLPAEIDQLKKLCKKYNLFFVEDAACALGASYEGKMVGGFGDLACFSFHPRKSITTGEGGVITTNSKNLYEKLISLRNHGVVKKDGEEEYQLLGFNYRMTDLQAAVGLSQFNKLKKIQKKTAEIAKVYNSALSKLPSVQTPFVPKNMKHVYQSYMIKVVDPKVSRDDLVKQLQKKGITAKKGIMLIHIQPLYRKLFGTISLPITEKLGKTTLILPLFFLLKKQEQKYIIKHLKEGLGV